MPRRFNHCAFGPFVLRPLLRSRLLRGEVVVGWGVVEKAAVGPAKTFRMGVAMAPVVGPIVAAALSAPKRRFLVLTDHRLFVLDAGVSARHGPVVVAETPLGEVRVATTSEKRVFRVSIDGQDTSQTVSVPKQDSRAADRLAAGLRVLAEG